MVGLCGVVGDSAPEVESLGDRLCVSGDERRQTCRQDGLAVEVVSHRRFHEVQPSRTADGSLVWLYGDVYGFDDGGSYRPRSDLATSDSEYCASLYDEYGLDFVSRLNGEFAGVVRERGRDDVHLFTDRIGSYPLYRASTPDAFLFSSSIQSIGCSPSFEPSFDRASLAEFFGVQKAFGTATPLEGVEKVPPASILTVASDGSVNGYRTYWRPRYEPVDRTPRSLAKAIETTFREVFAERLRDDLEYGVLLSGGSDSRLVLAAMLEAGRSPTAFHLTNWESRETRAAAAVASAAGVDFELLERDADYHRELLDHVPAFSNFIGAFDESIASGFADELAGVDVVLTGYLGDTMFGDYPLHASRSLRSGFRRREHRVRTVEEYVDRYPSRYSIPVTVPAFLDAPETLDAFGRNVVSDDGAIRHHGVRYPSIRELQLCEYYPLTNQFAHANTDSVRQITGHWSPFFDNRLIDLHLSVPVRERLREKPIDYAVNRMRPSLGAIPHASTGLPLAEPGRSRTKTALSRSRAFAEHLLFDDRPPAPYLTHGAWMHEGALIRNDTFVEEAIERNADLIEALPFLDRDGIDRCYRAHLDGTNNWRALYALVTLLETPVAQRVGSERRSAPSRHDVD